MFTEYLDKAMQHAQYEVIEDGTVFATIPGFDGLWANAPTPEECIAELKDALEGWVLLGIAHHSDLPLPHALDRLNAMQPHRLFKTAEEVDTYLQAERDSWNH